VAEKQARLERSISMTPHNPHQNDQKKHARLYTFLVLGGDAAFVLVEEGGGFELGR